MAPGNHAKELRYLPPWQDGNHVQQVDYSGGQPITTTYTNDNTGLSQVLVSDNGATQTTNLFGLSLIHQDDGTTVRTLLADGLGSVRTEMVDAAIDSATTYEPYGRLLARSGPSGTVYAFTGEQHDGASGLLYLRARYYSPGLKVFMSVDPFPGWPTVPASQHGYSYTHNNPVNLIDPTGLLICQAPQAGCAEWVQYALRKIEDVPLPIGKLLVQALWNLDRTLQGFQYPFRSDWPVPDCSDPLGWRAASISDMPGFAIIFTDDFRDLGFINISGSAKMVTRPTQIKIKLEFFKPPNPPDDRAILLFAHELVHVMQGPALAASIVGEVQAYQVQAALRPELFRRSSESDYEREAKAINLTDPAIRSDYARWSRMMNELEDWRTAFSDIYGSVPLLPCGGLCWYPPPPPPPFLPPAPIQI